MSSYEDVAAFHAKFEVPSHLDRFLGPLEPDVFDFRYGFLKEELGEIASAHDANDLQGFLDGLIDLVYVAYGTALMAGVSPELWQSLWNTVQETNMAKVRAASADDSAMATGRGHRFDVIKPEGWVSPDLAQKALLMEALLLAYDLEIRPVLK